MNSIHSYTGLGISGKPIVSLSRSNVSEKRVYAWVTDLENIYVPPGHQTPIFPVGRHFASLGHTTQDMLVSFSHSSFRDATDRRSFEARMISRHRTLHPGGLNVDFSFILSQRALHVNVAILVLSI